MYSKVYFILAHKKPEQLSALISLLQDGKSFFFIHVDKSVALHLFEAITQMEHCYFIKQRERSTWGGYGLVQATLNGMKEIQEYMKNNQQNVNYHCILLSGEDLPLKSNKTIHNFLESKPEKSFIHHWKLPYEKWWNGGLFRFESLYVFDYHKRPKAHYWLNKIIRKLQLHFLFPINRIKKKYPDVALYGGSQWMILSEKLIEFLVETSNRSPKFSKLFKYVLAPDELYFPTLIHHFQKGQPFVIENTPTHLILFEGNKPNPKYLSVIDLKDNSKETMLFARKFDNAINGDTIAYIQTIIKQ